MQPKLEAMTDHELRQERADLEFMLAEHTEEVINGRSEHYNFDDLNIWELTIKRIDKLLINAP